jgi:heavy metal sensor kinase
MKHFSIRIRLTAWYAAVLSVTFCLFGVGMFLAMQHSVNRAVDEQLRSRLRGVQSFLEREGPVESLEHLREEFQEHLGLTFEGDLLIVSDDQGNLIYHSGTLIPSRTAGGAPTEPDEPLFKTIREGQQQVRAVLSSVSVGAGRYTIQMATPMREFNEILERFQWLVLAAMPIVLILASVGGYWMSRKALQPVDEITKSARLISVHNLSQRLSVPETSDELQRLSETLNDMIGRLESAFKRITQFTADASHELRTPVALARTTAELSLRKHRSEAEYREALGQILAELERTTDLIEDLMTLARTDAGAVALQISQIDLVPMIQEVCLRSQMLAETKQLDFQQRIPDRSIFIHGDAQVLRRLFLILIDNAIKYTPPGGEVALSFNQENGCAIGEISDSGIGIEPVDISHIFERFYRADKARSRDSGGAGLGLSIAQWIAAAHGASIEVESSLGNGSLFRVRIPTVGS